MVDIAEASVLTNGASVRRALDVILTDDGHCPDSFRLVIDSDDTNSIIRARDAAVADGTRSLIFRGRTYTTGQIAITPPFSFRGQGSGQTELFLKSAANASLIAVSYVPSGVNLGRRDFKISGMRLHGNRASNTSGHVIELIDGDALTTADTKGFGIIGDDLHIKNAAQDGIYIGTNRNDGRVERSTIEYSGRDNVRFGSAGDWKFTGCNIGGATVNGVSYVGGYGSTFLDCFVFSNAKDAFQLFDTSQSIMIIGGGIDRNGEHGIDLDCGAGRNRRIILGTIFAQNSSAATNTYSDIKINNAQGVVISAAGFRKSGSVVPKHIVELTGTTVDDVIFQNNVFAPDDAPWGTALTNDFVRCNVSDFFERIAPTQTNTVVMVGVAISSTQALCSLIYERKRKNPSISFSGSWQARHGGGSTTITALSAPQTSRSRASVEVTVASGLTAGSAVVVRPTDGSSYILIDAT